MSENLMIGNAAGECKLLHHMYPLAQSPVTDIEVGSITMEPREGNLGATPMWSDDSNPEKGDTLNSLQLPNPGATYYRKHLPDMANIAMDAPARLRVNIAGFTPREFAQLAEIALEGGADTIVINAGCPNAIGSDGTRKAIPSENPDLLADIIHRVERAIGHEGDLNLKLTPLPPTILRNAIEAAVVSERIKNFVCSNTVPNCFAWASRGKPRITAPHGLAGLSGGDAMKMIALGQVIQVRALLDEFGSPGIGVIGVGGIRTGHDVLDYLDLELVECRLARHI